MSEWSPKENFDVWACFWVDAVKQEELEINETHPTPEMACTVGFLMHAGERSVSLVQEIFTDGHHRQIVTVPREMIKSLRRIGRVPVPRGLKVYLKALRHER